MRKFKEGDNLTWKIFLETCNEIDKRCEEQHHDEKNSPLPHFNAIEDAIKYFRERGGITVEEFQKRVRDEYGF